MLKSAFNAITRIHSLSATIKRLGSPDLYTPARVTPSNYFRFLRGPEYTTIRGREFIIPVDSLQGQFAQKITFSDTPDDGDFKLEYNSNQTAPLAYTTNASNIQTALRLLPGLSNVLVTGSFPEFIVTFQGFQNDPLALTVVDSTLEDIAADPITATITNVLTAWANGIKKADRIITSQGTYAADEVIEMHDLGGAIMGYRVRAE